MSSKAITSTENQKGISTRECIAALGIMDTMISLMELSLSTLDPSLSRYALSQDIIDKLLAKRDILLSSLDGGQLSLYLGSQGAKTSPKSRSVSEQPRKSSQQNPTVAITTTTSDNDDELDAGEADSRRCHRRQGQRTRGKNQPMVDKPPEEKLEWCDACLEEHQANCPIFDPLEPLHNTELPPGYNEPDRAMRTLPAEFVIRESGIEGAGLGVWTKVPVKKDVVFDPYEGEMLAMSVDPIDEYCWEIDTLGVPSSRISAGDTSKSNWLRYINCPRHMTEENIGIFQYQGKIRYFTKTDLPANVELLVYYGAEYADYLGLDSKSFTITSTPQPTLPSPTPVQRSKQIRRTSQNKSKPGNTQRWHAENAKKATEIVPETAKPRYTKPTKEKQSSEREPIDMNKFFSDWYEVDHFGDFPLAKPIEAIHDTQLPPEYHEPDRAVLTLPDGFVLRKSSIPGAGRGVWTKVKVNENTVFDAYEGVLIPSSGGASSMYCWAIQTNNKYSHRVDGGDTSRSNWLRYVNCARNPDEENVTAFQYRDKIYYRTCKSIPANTELLVYYGHKYALNLDIDPFKGREELDDNI